MAKNESLYVDAGPRKELVSVIKSHLSKDRISDALAAEYKTRLDMISHIVTDAIKNSPIVSFSGIPHVYSSRAGHYVSFDFHEFKTAIDESLRKSGIPDGNYSKMGKTVSDCWSEVMCRKYLIDTSVVVMGNGVFDTIDMKLHDCSESYMTNMSVPYDYNENEYPVLWKRFLSEVLPDMEMQDLLQEFIAATYVDRRFVKIEHMLTLLGSGSNGKSVVFEVLMALLGEDNVSTFSIRDLIGGGRSSQNLAMCNGKRLNYCSEMRTSQIGEDNADAFKSLVSGETMMARSLYKEPFRASNIPLMMANANKLPKLGDSSYSMQRRMLIIPFEAHIEEERQDKELAMMLKGELPGIFNWAMEGLARLRSNKYQLSIPDRVKKLVSEYFRDNNPLTRWLDDKQMTGKFVQGATAVPVWAKLSSLFFKFDAWCIENREPRISNRKFAESLEILGFTKSRRSDGIGFTYYTIPTREDVLAANMDLAISMESQVYVDAIKEAAKDGGVVRVEGVDTVEMYLGLPEGILWEYLKKGALEGTYVKVGSGKTVFNVKEVQRALASSDFYSTLEADPSSVKGRASKAIGGMRRAFNERMKSLGVPLRKYGKTNGVVPRNFGGCWIVPDDWEYSPRAARDFMNKEKPLPTF